MMKWSVAPAVIIATLGALSVVAVARAAHAAVGDAGEGELLGGPDQPTYGSPPAPARRTPQTPALRPTAPKPIVKPAPTPVRQAQVASAKPATKAPVAPVLPGMPAAPSRTAQVTPPAPWRSPIATRDMPQVAAPEIPAEAEPEDVASNNEPEEGVRDNASTDNDAVVQPAPPARDRAYAERNDNAGREISEQDFARLEQAIERGLAGGAIGRREAAWLYQELDDIAAMREDLLRGGRIGPEEHDELADRIAALSDRIYGAGDQRWRGRGARY